MKISTQYMSMHSLEISRTALSSRMAECCKRYARLCYELYDLGYIPSPSVFYEEDFLQALREYDMSVFKKLFSQLDGTRIENPLIIKYILHYVEDDTLKTVLSLYYDILTVLREEEFYTSVASSVTFVSNKETAFCKAKSGVSTVLSYACKANISDPCILNLLYTDDNSMLIEGINYSEIYIKYIMKDLGMEDEYLAHKETGQAFFLDGFTAKEEEVLLSLLWQGCLKLDGKFGEALTCRIIDRYENYYKTESAKTTCLDYISVIFQAALNECISEANKVRQKLKDDSLFSECFTTMYATYFCIDKGQACDTEYCDVRDFVETTSEGIYSVNNQTGEALSDLKSLGFGGEFILLTKQLSQQKTLALEGICVSTGTGLKYIPFYRLIRVYDKLLPYYSILSGKII